MQPRSILVLRLGSMGDIIHTHAAFATLRAAFPAATLGWVIEDRWRALLPSGVDVVHAVDTKAWRSAPLSDETWEEILDAIRGLRKISYDVAVDFQGAIRSSLIARFCGAPRRIGFAQSREKIATMFYTHLVRPLARHVVEQNVELALAVAPRIRPQFRSSLYSTSAARDWWSDQMKRLGLHVQGYAVVNPGAGWGAKRWPPERFGSVVEILGANGLPSVINFGPGEEELAQAVASASAGFAHAVLCSVEELVEVTRCARIFVGGDTGPVHLAAALGKPVVAIFGPTDPERTGPFGVEAVVLRSSSSRTTFSHHRETEQGLLEITPEQVASAALGLLQRQKEKLHSTNETALYPEQLS
ncbi:MAG TPA: glycosyltransferase family 9 protein [Terriglobales bacterium]|nr:glycosyltransferase family 9 protein [Terriglobales bacterium]